MTNPKIVEPADTVTSVADLGGPVPPRPGVTLSQMCELLRARGRACYWDADAGQAWVLGPAYTLHRLPHGSEAPPAGTVLRQVLRQKGVWLATFETPPSPGQPANCFEYVCREPHYSVELLDHHGRRDVRRGLRSFEVRRTTAEEIADHGYTAQRDTDERHRYVPPTPEAFRRSVLAGGNMPYYEHWAAWADGQIAAFMGVTKLDNWAIFGGASSANAFLRNCPNNALGYQATRQMLVVERRAFVTYGLSALRECGNELAMHKYKTRMGYVANLRHRAFHCHPVLRPFIAGPAARAFWRGLARLRSQDRMIQMVAGLAELSGSRADEALAWAVADHPSEPK